MVDYAETREDAYRDVSEYLRTGTTPGRKRAARAKKRNEFIVWVFILLFFLFYFWITFEIWSKVGDGP